MNPIKPQYPLTLRFPKDILSKETTADNLKYLFYMSQLDSWVPLNGKPYKVTLKSMRNLNSKTPITSQTRKVLTRLLMNHLTASLSNPSMIGGGSRQISRDFMQQEPTLEQKQKFTQTLLSDTSIEFSDAEKAVIQNHMSMFINGGVPTRSSTFLMTPESEEAWVLESETIIGTFKQILIKLMPSIAAKNEIAQPEDVSSLNTFGDEDDDEDQGQGQDHDEDEDEDERIEEEMQGLIKHAFEVAGIPLTKVSFDAHSHDFDEFSALIATGDSEDRKRLDLSINIHDYDSEVLDQTSEVGPASDKNSLALNLSKDNENKYQNAIKDVLFLAVCAADANHLSCLLEDPQTLAIAQREGGLWLLARVVGSDFSVEPFGSAQSNIDATLGCLIDKKVIDEKDEWVAELICKYRHFFEVNHPNLLPEPAASSSSAPTQHPVMFLAIAKALVNNQAQAAIDEDQDEALDPAYTCNHL